MHATFDTPVVPEMSRAAVLSEANRSDQRLNGRYPITLELQYRLLNKGRIEHLGAGRTLNISSGGVLFEADDRLPTSGPIELAMSWPFLLEGVCCLKLIMRGRIVRCDEGTKAIAVKAEYHEFRTAGVRSLKARAIARNGASSHA
jgi:hypothetical protein